MPIIQNKLHTQAVIRATANESYTLADFQLTGETVTAIDITQVYWCGSWTIARDANVILSLINGDNWFLEGVTALREDNAGSLVITAPASGGGTLILVVKKQVTTTDQNF
jgi:hypothetical protein